MTEEQNIKRLTYLFEYGHKEYGRLEMVRLITGERYCFFVKDNLVSMIPYFMVKNDWHNDKEWYSGDKGENDEPRPILDIPTVSWE